MQAITMFHVVLLPVQVPAATFHQRLVLLISGALAPVAWDPTWRRQQELFHKLLPQMAVCVIAVTQQMCRIGATQRMLQALPPCMPSGLDQAATALHAMMWAWRSLGTDSKDAEDYTTGLVHAVLLVLEYQELLESRGGGVGIDGQATAQAPPSGSQESSSGSSGSSSSSGRSESAALSMAAMAAIDAAAMLAGDKQGAAAIWWCGCCALLALRLYAGFTV